MPRINFNARPRKMCHECGVRPAGNGNICRRCNDILELNEKMPMNSDMQSMFDSKNEINELHENKVMKQMIEEQPYTPPLESSQEWAARY